jgi:hypothetical protein
MIPTRDTALAHLPALAARQSLRRITPLHDAAPPRAAQFSATLDAPTLDDANLPIDTLTRDALCPLAEAADPHDASTAAPFARFRAPRSEA